MYIPLHWHSTFSFLEAVSAPDKIAKTAKELWFPAIAIEDFWGMYWLPAFFQAAKSTEIKAILGVELGFVIDINANLTWKPIWNITLIAINNQWYKNLMKLTSFATQDGLSIKPKVDIARLRERNEWVLIFYGGLESWLWKMRHTGEKTENILEIHNMIREIFGENCYLEIIAQDESIIPKLHEVNQLCLSLSSQTATKCIVQNEFFYPSPNDYKTREIALAIKDNVKLYDQYHRQPAWQYHIMTEDQIKEICLHNGYSDSQITDWLRNCETIADQVSAKIEFLSWLFPNYEAPEDINQLYQKYSHSLIE